MLKIVLEIPAQLFSVCEFVFLNIVVSYQPLHFVHVVLIYEIPNDDYTADVSWHINKNLLF